MSHAPAFSNAAKKAFELSRRPKLLFNIGQAYRLQGDFKQAKFFYESFLRAMVRRLDFSTFGRVSSSTPSFIAALAFASSTRAGSSSVREKAPCEISQR